MKCYSCRKYDTCPLGWKCSADMYGCSAYEVKQTNEEYLRSCTTEQLAEVLFSWYKLGRLDVINKHTEVKKDWLIEHLKQPHTAE